MDDLLICHDSRRRVLETQMDSFACPNHNRHSSTAEANKIITKSKLATCVARRRSELKHFGGVFEGGQTQPAASPGICHQMIYIRQDLLVINELLPGDKLLIIVLRIAHLCTLFPDEFIQVYSNNYKPVKDLLTNRNQGHI